MQIRNATYEDHDGYHSLVESLQYDKLGNSESGFLFPISFEGFEEIVNTGFMLVAIQNSKLVGVISGYTNETELFQATINTPGAIQWFQKVPFDSDKLVYIYNWGVLPECKGLGLKLLFNFKKEFKGYDMITTVVEKPNSNLRTPRFADYFGFKRVGQFNSDLFYGMKDYQSGIYLAEAE